MAIRELVTLFTFKLDQTGVNQYKTAMGGIMDLAKTGAKLFGLAFGAEKIFEFVDGLVDSGKELNKITYQIGRLARDQDDFSNIQETLLKSATMLGVSYIAVADTFKEMLRESQDLEISQEQILTTTENIYKAARVEKLNAGETKNVLDFMNTAFRRGGLLSVRAVNTLDDLSHETMKVLMESYGVSTMEGMTELAKAGKLTTESIVEHLSKSNTRLNADFAKAPITLGVALTNIYSRLTKVAALLFKTFNNSVLMGKAITAAFNLAVDAIKGFISAMGGAERVTRLFSIALAVILGIKIIGYIRALAAAMWTLSAASWAAALPYLAWAAAIALVVLALEDLYVWITGGKSVAGDMLGSFEDFQKTLTQTWDAVKDGIINAFNTALEWIKTTFNELLAFFIKLGTDIGAAFVKSWTTALNTLKEQLPKLFAIAIDIKNAFVDAFTFIETTVINIFNSILAKFEGWKNAIIDGFNTILDKFKAMFNIFGGKPAVPGAPGEKQQTPAPSPAPYGTYTPVPLPPTVDPNYKAPAPYGSYTTPPTTTMRNGIPTIVVKPEVVSSVLASPSIAPGVVQPGGKGSTENNQTNTINLQPSITVNMTPQEQEIANTIRTQMNGMTKDAIDTLARQLAVSAPRNEMATQ